MADDIDLDLELDEGQDQVSKAEKRIKNLSEKVKLTATERDELAKGKEEEARLRAEAEKERDFFKNFNSLTTKYSGVAEFQDKIKEKVMSGYDVEDAAISILAKEGKYTPPPAPAAPKESPAGGSAVNAIPQGGEKSLSEMSRDEKKAQLEEVANKGDIRFGSM